MIYYDISPMPTVSNSDYFQIKLRFIADFTAHSASSESDTNSIIYLVAI